MIITMFIVQAFVL